MKTVIAGRCPPGRAHQGPPGHHDGLEEARKDAPQKKHSPTTPGFRISGLQKCEGRRLCWLSRSVVLSGQPEAANPASRE